MERQEWKWEDNRSTIRRLWQDYVWPVIVFISYTLGVLIMILFAYLFIMDWWEGEEQKREPIPVWKLEQDAEYPERGWP